MGLRECRREAAGNPSSHLGKSLGEGENPKEGSRASGDTFRGRCDCGCRESLMLGLTGEEEEDGEAPC